MKLSINWLKDFVDINISAEELANKLTNSGFEVEEVIRNDKGMEKVFVGKIEKITKHPNAEKLSVCELNMGDKHLQILTAATNVFEGAYVPVATDGADLPCGVLIKTTNMRGLESQGMLCSGHELSIDDSVYEGAEVDGIMILKDDVKAGEHIAKVLGLDDVVLDVTVLGNRPDCNSVLGLAREISTMLNLPLKQPAFDFDNKNNASFDVEINTKDCLRYMGAVIKNVRLAPSPKWMQDRLRAVGINPKNNIVDITNYVLMEIGQPMHAFDLDKVDRIVVRQASKESIKALNSVTYDLNESNMVICDSKKPIAIAGVMGGEDASVNDDTQNVLFESASFARASIRYTSKGLGLRSDSSARYERGVEPTLNEMGLNRALSLVKILACGDVLCIVDKQNCDMSERTLDVNYNEINNLLGVNISIDKMKNILNSLNIKTTITGDMLSCEIPSFRTDLTCLADIAEEIIRICGLDEIKVKNKTEVSTINSGYNKLVDIKHLLVNSGLYEVKTFSLNDGKSNVRLMNDCENPIQISNPLNDNIKALRTNLIDSILEVVSFNLNRGNKDLKLFEIGRKYSNRNNEITTLCVALSGKTDFFELKKILIRVSNLLNFEFDLSTDISFPYNKYASGKVIINGESLGLIGEIHPLVLRNYDISEKVYVLELELNKIFNLKENEFTYKPISKFPSIIRDLNFVVPYELSYKTLYDEICHSAGKFCTEVDLVDIYEGEQVEQGFRSMSFRVKFEKQDATLLETEVEQAVARLLRSLEYKLKVLLRR